MRIERSLRFGVILLNKGAAIAGTPTGLDGVPFTVRTPVHAEARMKKTEAFRVLASADRQLILHELITREGTASLDELSRQVAARRHRVSPETISSNKIERAKVRLVHTHLSQLVETNIVDVDWNEKTVALRDDEEIDRLFEAAEELERWPPDDLLESSSQN